MSGETLLCWHAVRAGPQVLAGALDALADRGHPIARVLLLTQAGRELPVDLPKGRGSRPSTCPFPIRPSMPRSMKCCAQISCRVS